VLTCLNVHKKLGAVLAAIAAILTVVGCQHSGNTRSGARPPTMSGTYTFTLVATGATAAWHFTPCGPGCANVHYPDKGSTVQAQFAGGQWIFDHPNDPDQIVCNVDGSKHPGDLHHVWDPNYLRGWRWATAASSPCPGDPPGSLSTPPVEFTLTPVS
jgi:hypothetical protein